ncbi:hypothetical protein BLL37_16520 [Pseudomonas azotoformans]|uniref:Uncharacterized protein n=1 Tax=Pseudomonas azotoformans TaxID=47878 RepID=A0A1V2JK72_PSEAZ|nr:MULTISPECIES: hypothetical protein [Pseudomonas]OIN46553.1 hypothetical protein BFL39_22480 [Pseudomonas azotoformans]ONH45011.1 hypothetical protein BLL37_16520 [Pseudomonas azotoformans]BDB19910.1 hypothetical protein cym2001_32750 [Pseudomonas sp. CYM-20-01]SDN09457.1 hypothetical protein SAMN04489799_1058 [Pseudomonas azotoformans]
MAVLLTAEQMRHTKASNPFQIKHPEQVVNKFTITDASKASDTLKLGNQQSIDDLKAFLKDYDMTSITTNELKVVGRRLYESGVIDGQGFRMFITGLGAFDENGQPAETDVKYNAIALFDEVLEDYLSFVEGRPDVQRSQGIPEYIQGMFAANHAINALAFFVNSSRSDLSIEERA